MKLRELEAFQALMEAGSVTGAAARLRLTQPQVSRLVAALEAECGFALFVRQHQRLVPTTEARLLYLETERLLRGFDEVKGAVERIRGRQSDHVRIVTSQPLAEGLVAPALRRAADDNLKATFSIEIRSKMEFELRIAQHHFDLGIASLPIRRPDVTAEPFASREALLVLPHNHPRSGETVIALHSLGGERLVVTRKGTYLRDHLDNAFEEAGVAPNILVETALSGFACRLVTQGVGISLTDPFVASAHMHEGIVLRRAAPALQIDYAFVLPKWQPISSSTRALMACVREVSERLGWPGGRAPKLHAHNA